MSAPKNKKSFFKVFFPIFIVVVISALFVWYFKFRPVQLATKESVKPSQDQQELVDSFGYPDTFTLQMMDNLRYETWNYYEVKRGFIFLDGVFVEDQIIDNLDGDYQFPEFKPTQFTEGMSLADVKKFLGDPTREGEVSSELLENSKIYDFWDQVKVGTKEDKIVYVETLPVFVPEQFRVRVKDEE